MKIRQNEKEKEGGGEIREFVKEKKRNKIGKQKMWEMIVKIPSKSNRHCIKLTFMFLYIILF